MFHRPAFQHLLALLIFTGLGALAYRGLDAQPHFELRGELHHLWAGPVSGRCTLQLASFRSELGGTAEHTWTRQIVVTEGDFAASLPDALLNDAKPWVELVVWCPSLDPSPVVLRPRVALTTTARGSVKAAASAWLCVIPHDQQHGEIPLRGASLTLYSRFLDSTLVLADESLQGVLGQLMSFKEYMP